MHPANPYASKKPDFKDISSKYPFFASFVTTSEDGFSNIDWKDVQAVRALNQALLKQDWNLAVEMKEDRLCPPIPNRLDYLYHMLDLEPYLESGKHPMRVIDIGTGAMAIYPLLLHRLRPNAIILATEKDHDSLVHSREVLAANNVGPEAITVLELPSDEVILFPLLNDLELKVDITMCNPPFYASDKELQEGVELKMEGPHAAASGAHHELICDGGEAAFIGQMITESIKIGTRCTWYTSLVGRYQSLLQLTSQLKRDQIDNYYIIISQPAKTHRWILIWSHSSIRLPDTFRTTGLPTGMIPPSNSWQHPIDTSQSSPDLKDRIVDYLESVKIPYTDESTEVTTGLTLTIHGNTWSRAARRKQQQNPLTDFKVEDPMKASLKIVDDAIELNWTYGGNRADIDSLWKSMLVKIGVIDRVGAGGHESVTEDDHGSRKKAKADTS